jgi:hypothetical protein
MTESAQSETLHSHIMQLLQEQKYDEALPILIDLSEKNPSDRELRMYRLLVIRILVLRWNLSRTATGKAIQSCSIGRRNHQKVSFSPCASLIPLKLIRSLNFVFERYQSEKQRVQNRRK